MNSVSYFFHTVVSFPCEVRHRNKRVVCRDVITLKDLQSLTKIQSECGFGPVVSLPGRSTEATRQQGSSNTGIGLDIRECRSLSVITSQQTSCLFGHCFPKEKMENFGKIYETIFITVPWIRLTTELFHNT